MNDDAQALVDAMKTLVEKGITNPRGGNGSFRRGSYVWITPSGLPKHRLAPTDLVVYDLERGVAMGFHKPSIEIHAHLAIYRVVSEARAVLHAHAPFSTALCDLGLGEWWRGALSEIEYSVGSVYIADPAPPGSQKLAENIGRGAATGARLIVVPRHGLFAWGRSVYEALDAIIAFEDSAKYVAVKSIIEYLRALEAVMRRKKPEK